MTRKQKRLTVIGGAMGFLALAAALTFAALGQKTSYFYMPADLQQAKIAPGQRIRLGGLVEDGTVRRGEGTRVSFAVTDQQSSVKVVYTGLLPDLFREGQGVITEGTFGPDGLFVADSVLAKHDENYMPKEVADALKKQGHWKDDYDKKPSAAAQGRAQ
jgi:cytochrome c-type biogenesis protein CcmE